MIGDISRTGTYRKAILGNEAVAIRDKTVLDLGAGVWPAAAGAKPRLGHPVVHVCPGGGEERRRARGVVYGRQDPDG